MWDHIKTTHKSNQIHEQSEKMRAMEKKGQKKQVASKSLKQGTQESAAHAKEKTVVSRIEEHDIDGTMAGSTGKDVSGHEGSARPNVSPAVVRRLPRYFRYLRELLAQNVLRISSAELCKMMNITASQIRQDLNCFGGFGQQGYGYNVRYLYHKIGEILGVDNKYTAVIIGAGHLGGAIAGSTMFEKRGMMLVGIFDSDPRVIGRNLSGQKVKDIAQIDYFLGEIHVDVAILTLPKEKTNEMAQRLAAGGVRGFWNFTNAQIDRSKYNIIVENVHMGDSLMQLMYELTLTAPKKDGTSQEEENNI